LIWHKLICLNIFEQLWCACSMHKKIFFPSAFREGSICKGILVSLAPAKGDLWRGIGKLGTCPDFLTQRSVDMELSPKQPVKRDLWTWHSPPQMIFPLQFDSGLGQHSTHKKIGADIYINHPQSQPSHFQNVTSARWLICFHDLIQMNGTVVSLLPCH
jgi:hypothetical protein